MQSQSAIIHEHRMTGGIGVRDFLMRGLDFDAFAGGMFPASQTLGNWTTVNVASSWVGLGFTWRFDQASSARRDLIPGQPAKAGLPRAWGSIVWA